MQPRFIVRDEPINVVRYAGNDRDKAKQAYHAPMLEAADMRVFFEEGQFRGVRRHRDETPVRA